MANLEVKGVWSDTTQGSVYVAKAIYPTGRIIATVTIDVAMELQRLRIEHPDIVKDVETIASDEVLKIAERLPQLPEKKRVNPVPLSPN